MFTRPTRFFPPQTPDYMLVIKCLLIINDSFSHNVRLRKKEGRETLLGSKRKLSISENTFDYKIMDAYVLKTVRGEYF